MATMDITSSTKNNFKVRLEYTAGGGAISITNIGGCRTDGYDSASQNAQNRVNISIAGNSVSTTPSNNTVRFTKNNNYSYWGVGHSLSGLNGNTSISVSIYTPSNSTINGLTFNATINAGTSATAPTGVTCYSSSHTETSITIGGRYSSDGGSAITTSGYQYRTATGNWTNCGSTITGLTANTPYYFRYYVGNAIGTTYSDEILDTTPDYPHIMNVSVQELTVGNQQGLLLYNPLYRNVTVRMNKGSASGTLLYSGTTSSDSGFWYYFTPNANTLYSSIPNDTNATCVYTVVYGNVTRSTSGTYKYKIKNDGTEIPTFDASKWSYSSNLTQLTNNNQCVINGYSTLTYTVNSQATSSYGATISRYNYKWGNKSTASTLGNTVVGGNGTTLTVDAVDSRGLLKSTSKTLVSGTTYVPYTVPTLDYSYTSTRRVDGVTATTYLDVKGKLSVMKFGNAGVNNALYSVKYKVYNYSTGSWTTEQFTIPTSEFTLASDGTFTLDDYLIHANGESGGFAVGTKYAIQLEIKDANGLLGTLTSSNILVTDGKLAVDCYQDSDGEYHRGINGLATSNYNQTINGSEQVTKAIAIPKNNGAGYGLTNSSGNSIIRDWNNNNVTVDATGDGLYLGYQNTNFLYLLKDYIKVTSNGINFLKTSNNAIYWKEGNYGDKFQIVPSFSGSDNDNKLKVQGAVGGAGTDPALYDLAAINAVNGDLWLKGYVNQNIAIGYYTENKQINAEYVYPSFGAAKTVGSKLTLSSGKIKVGAGVTKVKISACAFLENLVSPRVNYLWMFVYKNNNSTSVASAIVSGTPQYYLTASITDIIVDVAQNDTLYLGFNLYPVSTTPVTIRNGIANTRLYVEAIA